MRLQGIAPHLVMHFDVHAKAPLKQVLHLREQHNAAGNGCRQVEDACMMRPVSKVSRWLLVAEQCPGNFHRTIERVSWQRAPRAHAQAAV